MEKPNKSEISPKYPDSWNNVREPENFAVGKAKVESLKDLVDEINHQIAERKNLSMIFIKEGEKMKRDINNFLLESAPRGDDDSDFARERAELRKKQIEISEIQLNEKVGCWRDIAELKAELRERAKELTEKESRAEEIRKILEEE